MEFMVPAAQGNAAEDVSRCEFMFTRVRSDLTGILEAPMKGHILYKPKPKSEQIREVRLELEQ